MVVNSTGKEEKEYLQQIISMLQQIIENTDISVKEHVDTLAEYKDYLWSNKDIDPHEIRSMRESILNHFALGENVIDKRRRFAKILDIPYFGRIDFQEKRDGSKVLPLYIGVHTFYHSESKTTLIYDWRAPVSSMFYDHELGEASFLSPSGEIAGNISLKRQYRIRKGKMEFMIESALAVHDDILQKELSANFRTSACKSLGILCKTEVQAEEMAGKLKSYVDDISFLSCRSSAFVQGVVVTSAHMAKGLEFDEVIVPQVNHQNYHSEIDRSMLYVAVTRAMHRLILTYNGVACSSFCSV